MAKPMISAVDVDYLEEQKISGYKRSGYYFSPLSILYGQITQNRFDGRADLDW